MRIWVLFFCVATHFGALSAQYAFAQNEPSIERTAALSEYVSRVEVLEGMVRDLSMTAAVSLLSQSYPSWAFESKGGFDSYAAGVFPQISNDLGGVAAKVENAFTYIRGKYVRNDAVSDAQREEALEIIKEILSLVQTCREMASLLADEKSESAAAIFRDGLVPASDALTLRIRSLTNELNQQIKFSAL